MNNKNKSKRSSKNLKINTRIVLTTVLAIVIPIVIIATFSTVFIQTISAYFNFSTVTTNTYSTINQIQWSQTLWGITTELSNDTYDEQKKLDEISDFVAPLEQLGSKIYIERDNEVFYSTDDADIVKRANELTTVNKEQNLNYFGDDGLVIVNHTHSSSNSYMVLILNEDFTVDDATKRPSIRDLTNLILSRTGIIVLVIVGLFAVAIAIISLITTKTIVNPIKKIARGADEIARGNLDYNIDYNSTNELGQTVNSFNDMRIRLKESIEKQRAASEESRVLVAGIAHDLRTPLTSAKGYAEGIIDGIADTPEKKEHYVKTILQSINDTEQILDDLMTVSRLELKGYQLNLVDVNVLDFFNDAVQAISEILDNEGFDFEYSFNCTDTAAVALDPDRFERVISNIISNSVKYAREDIKGKIKLEINEYEHTVIIAVSDNGIGVDRESLPKIFDTMYRADPARTKVSDGSGLGLSVCRQIVSLHGGSIWASSKENEGLTVYISLSKREVQSDEQGIDY